MNYTRKITNTIIVVERGNMKKQIYISADYSKESGDRDVVDTLNGWSNDKLHSIEFVDMAKVVSGSVAQDSDCRPCDLKKEFNRQINASSIVICVVGDKTASRKGGSECSRVKTNQFYYPCTPYKQNTNGSKFCNKNGYYLPSSDVKEINSYSYLRHEFEQAKNKNKTIIILYNSTRNELSWLPSYMKGYEASAIPFWVIDNYGRKIGNYFKVKEVLGYE